MQKIDFNNKTFTLIDNSKKGKASAETLFKYQQDGNLVTAEYSGGDIRYGKIIAVLKDHQLDMRYQCLTTDQELKTGKAIAAISFTEAGKIRLRLNWEWLGEADLQWGISEYIEQ